MISSAGHRAPPVRRKAAWFGILAGLVVGLLPTAASADWLTYHLDVSRSGNDIVEPAATTISAAWTSSSLDADVYAEPLVLGANVLIATENNTIYSLDAGTGEVVWQTNLGAPVPQSSLPCGNIDPVGITGTPVIDAASHTLYAVAMLSQPDLHYQLFAVDALSGAVSWSQRIAPSGFNARTQGQRGALVLSGGNVYIPFGGRAGDCTPYSAWVVGAPAAGPGTLFWFGPLSAAQDAGGIWAASGLAVGPSGNIYGTTGNTFCTSPCAFDFGESIIALSPALARLDYWAPTNWSSLNAGDTDVGSVGPTFVTSNLIFQVGKSGDGELVHAAGSMGGISNAPYSAHVCPGLTADAAFGGTAYTTIGGTTYLYAPCFNGIEALTVNTAAPSFAQLVHGPTTSFSGPPIVAGGYVWTIDPAGTLYALYPTTLSLKFSASIGGAVHFATPAAGDGRVFVAAGGTIQAFALTPLPALRRSPRSLPFGSQQVGTTSAAQTSTVTNVGNATLSISSIAASGDFAQTNDCGAVPVMLAPGASCHISVTFTPTTFGARAGAVTITDNATGSPHIIALSGEAGDGLGGQLSSGPDASSWPSTGQIDVFARCLDGSLCHKTFIPGTGWGSWSYLGGRLTSDPSAVSWANGRIDVFTRGPDNGLWHIYFDGGSWSGWQDLGGILASGPEVASWGFRRLDVFAKCLNGTLCHKWFDGTSWSGWESLGGSLTSDPTAVSWASGRIDVFTRGSDNGLWHLYFDTAGWSTWQDLGGILASGPAVTSTALRRLDVFALCLDKSLCRKSFDGTSWLAWQSDGGQWTSDPGATSSTAGRIDVVIRGVETAIWHLSF
jgi:outer membrane protein assembly factor BamB